MQRPHFEHCESRRLYSFPQRRRRFDHARLRFCSCWPHAPVLPLHCLKEMPRCTLWAIWQNTTEKANAPVVEVDLSVGVVPKTFDWRKKGVVTPVNTQGHCGSCWAFSAVETVESALAIATGEPPVPLSIEQILVCCTTIVHSQCSSCMGGIPSLLTATSRQILLD